MVVLWRNGNDVELERRVVGILTLYLESRGCVLCHIGRCRKIEDTTGAWYIHPLCG